MFHLPHQTKGEKSFSCDIKILTANDRGNLAARFLLQECQGCHLPADDDTKSLFMVVQKQENHVHGQVSIAIDCQQPYSFRNNKKIAIYTK